MYILVANYSPCNAVSWVHRDPLVKAKRVTNGSGTVVSTVELDPFDGHTNRNNNDNFQPQKFTSYTRDANAVDDAMFRRYNRWFARFEQPDPYDGSYNLTNPQSFNRYSYVQNDPVNHVDPFGLDPSGALGRALVGLDLGPVGPGTSTVTVPITISNDEIEIEGSVPDVFPTPGGTGGPSADLDSQPQNPTERLPFNTCEEFISWLAEQANADKHWLGSGRFRSAYIAGRVWGSDLIELVYLGYDRHIHNGARRKRGKNPRGAGVYGHISFRPEAA